MWKDIKIIAVSVFNINYFSFFLECFKNIYLDYWVLGDFFWIV